eukprot:TRINITY_DN18039_c0_g1_i1.p1 TRINITY_DN18039_c0_g1~~TRINITY_DN18039_c0_g1_i1.p1  ORF type:complete len:983 (+),score=248.19 TRINITY_DN18039_c0_g1_i1:186-3134(+)
MSELASVAAAAQALCDSATDAATRQEASRWLTEYRQSASAWGVLLDCLGTPNAPVPVLFVAAQLLRTKATKDAAAQLDAAAQGRALNRVGSELLRFAAGPNSVRTQLCLALCHLAAQGADGGAGVVAAASSLAAAPGAGPQAALELLTLLAEEADAVREALAPPESAAAWSPRAGGALSPAHRRGQASASAAAQRRPDSPLSPAGSPVGSPPSAESHPLLVSARGVAQWAAGFLMHHAQQLPPAGVLRCFALWLPVLGPTVQPGELAASPLVAAALHHAAATGGEAGAAACDVVCELAMLGGADAQRWQPLVERVTALVPPLHAAREAAARGGDTGRALAITRALASVGISFVSLVAAASSDAALTMVRVLAECSSSGSRDAAAVTLPFWLRLSCELASCGEQERLRRLQGLGPLLEQPLMGIARAAQCTPDDDLEDDEEQLDEYRTGWVLRTVDGLAVMLGVERAWAVLHPAATAALRQIAAAPCGDEGDRWRAPEAACALLGAEALRKPLASAAPELLQLAGAIAAAGERQHWRLRATVTAVAARAAERAIGGCEALLGPAVQLTTQGLADPKTAPSCARALKRIVQMHGKAAAGQLGTIAEALLRAPPAVQEPVAEAFGCVVFRLPPEQARAGVESICAPVLAALQAALGRSDWPAAEGQLRLLATLLARAALMSRPLLASKQSGQAAAAHAWQPALSTVCAATAECLGRMPGDEPAALAASCLRSVCTVFGKELAPQLPAIAELVRARFAATLQPPLLSVARSLCFEYGAAPGRAQQLSELWGALGSAALPVLAAPPAFSRRDLAEKYFLELGRSATFIGGALAAHQAAADACSAALAALDGGCNHPAVLTAAAGCAKALAAADPSGGFLQAATADGSAARGHALTRAALRGSVASWEAVEGIAGMLRTIRQVCPRQSIQWTGAACGEVASQLPPAAAAAAADAFAGLAAAQPSAATADLAELLGMLHRAAASVTAVG